MPKTKRRKKKQSRSATTTKNVVSRERIEGQAAGGSIQRGFGMRSTSLQSVVFALMVTLGFVGFAIFFTFFYSEDANHFLYGGVMGLTALGWLVIATRRWSSYRQRARA